MAYTVYKTTNLANGKFYLGVHKTENQADDYLGSGKYLRRAIAKYGTNSFQKEVLFLFENPAVAFECERDLVAAVLGNKLCMNMKHGGDGGFDFINSHGLNDQPAAAKKAEEARIKLIQENPVFRKAWIEQCKRAGTAASKSPVWRVAVKPGLAKGVKTWTGHKHSAQFCKSQKERMLGVRNPSYGTRWMFRNDVEQKVKSSDVEQFFEAGWSFGRLASKVEGLVHRKVRSS